eukprot:GGOE01008766.1.p1 GENE.GGOE01008766.1~~GGOE01008766.1.p1  ORF type:complete len:925 (-),score=97.32 GGOE01008766.1:1113-3518(-)
MAHRAGFDGYYLRDWQLQASNDAQQWVVLQEHKGDESLNKKSLVAAWPIEGCQNFYHYFQVVIAPNGNNNNTNALILSCFELYGTLKRPIVHPPSSEQGHPPPVGTITSTNGWQSADGSRPFRVATTTRSLTRQASSPFGSGDVDAVLPEATTLCKGRVVTVSWQGGSIQLLDYPESAELVPYHKSDVWVDDKKVKQLPREGDLVSFYIVVDDITKKEKAEQVTVINHQRKSSAPDSGSSVGDSTSLPSASTLAQSFCAEAQVSDVKEGGLKVSVRKSVSVKAADTGTKLNPEAPSFTPRCSDSVSTNCSDGAPSVPETEAIISVTVPSMEAKSSFLFEHCTGRVVQVSVPTGQIQIDGAPEGAPTIPYHYSDVWDDGKCVKQFPRVGDTVSCYIGIDPKTKKEKAENVKVICKKQHSDGAPERTQVRQTIQNARYRAAANVAHAGSFRAGNGGPVAAQRPPVPFGPPPMFFDYVVPHIGSDVHPSGYGALPDPNMGNCISPQGIAHPQMPVLPTQVSRCPLQFGRPQLPAVNMLPLQPQTFANSPPMQQPVFMGYASQYSVGNGMGPLSTPTKNFVPQYSTFTPVVGSPNRGSFGAMSTPPGNAALPTMSPIMPMQYTEGASPMLYSVGASRNSPPQSPSPSPSTGLSMSSNSSLGTLNASCSEVEACSHGLEIPARSTPSPVSQSPFDSMHEEQLQKPVDFDVMHNLAEEYSCHTPEKRNSGLTAWTAGNIFGLPASDRSKRPRIGHHDALEALLPRSPIIGDILRPTGDETQDELLDHDLLSGDSALVALHAVSVLDF